MYLFDRNDIHDNTWLINMLIVSIYLNSVIVKFIIWCFTENHALHKPAWQSSTYKSYTADLAVDARYTDLRYNRRQCAISEWKQRTAEWWLDLGGVKYIHHVFIQYMTGNRVWGIVSFKLIDSFNLTRCIIYRTIIELKWRMDLGAVLSLNHVLIQFVIGNSAGLCICWQLF